ncbi:unnamed protein product [Owenia fusiformis]|uniref:Uncharacterized protein n=1 Tax=Owenia fusiformis TaxID=6347 RepID=A0A8J1U4Z2_OWEFU|nr:unnamed protein product [Owenia fusiformis]
MLRNIRLLQGLFLVRSNNGLMVSPSCFRLCSSTSSEQNTTSKLPPNKKSERLEERYSAQESSKILEKINTYQVQDFETLKWFSKPKAVSLVQARKVRGPFESLYTLAEVPKFTNIKLYKVCDALLYNTQAERVPKRASASDVNPPLTPEKCKNIKSLVAMEIRLDNISWVHMDSDLRVIQWEQESFFEQYSARYDHAEYQTQLSRVVSMLPEADMYSYELIPQGYTNLQKIPYQVNNAIIQAIITTMLNMRHQGNQSEWNSDINRVYTIKSYAVQKYFNLNLGGERVSSRLLLDDVISRENVPIPKDIMTQYMSYDNIGKELLTRCLFQAVAFYKLGVRANIPPLQKARVSTKPSSISIEKLMHDKL